jgi:DNA-directed RNA polymerase subunit RPC12/RpoP
LALALTRATLTYLSASSGIRCPKCGGRDIRTSHRSTLLDFLMMQFDRMPLRCRGCSRRFHKRVMPEDLVEKSEPVPEDAKTKEPAKPSEP